ncbi:fumarylacetoacetate hydrolase family protein [Mycolicibacterium sp.]|uniref:fumarylacetoacetate hydrolase family protein n=1 Tax=Mycolicibacterium sp. TaxID=2320850 RepID=UPI003D0D6732
MVEVLTEWSPFLAWAAGYAPNGTAAEVVDVLGPPVPNPRQIFAVGLNYIDHATESGFVAPTTPMIFAKFPSSVCGPEETVELPTATVDWEVELVVVVGIGGHSIPVEDAHGHIAGVMVGQDLSERTAQMQGEPPQFSLAKSHPCFAPIGPTLVTLDEIPSLDALHIECVLNGETVQSASTGDMVFTVAELVAYISRTATLLPGDLIFTGTPAGVGMGRDPVRYLAPGDTLVSRIEGVGELVQHFVPLSVGSPRSGVHNFGAVHR